MIGSFINYLDYLVMATQNPIEQEGTYPLPEAQLDRFLLHVEVGYPSVEDERRILVLNRDESKLGNKNSFEPSALLSEKSILEARQEILALHQSDDLEKYIVDLVVATRDPGKADPSLTGQILYGASPRACMGIDRAARACAWFGGKDYVGPVWFGKNVFANAGANIMFSAGSGTPYSKQSNITQEATYGIGVP